MMKMTHCSLGLDHVLWTLAAAAELHGTSSLLVEDDTEQEDKGALQGEGGRGGVGSVKTKPETCPGLL